MSKNKARKSKSKSVSGKAHETGAMRFLKIRHGDRAWLLAHTAIVAGTMGVAMIGAPNLAFADPGCADNGVYNSRQQFNCNGVSAVDYASVATVPVNPTQNYNVFFDGGDNSTPFIARVSNDAVVHVNGSTYDGTIVIEDGAIFDNEDGDGFVLESNGYTSVDHDGYISGGSEDGTAGFVMTGAGDLDMEVGEDGEIYGGVGFYSETTGDVELTNYGHIEGNQEDGAGVYVINAESALLANHSYHSVMGDDGFYVENTQGYVEVDNEHGLTVGLGGHGVHINGVDFTSPADGAFEAVAVYNGDSGIIIGDGTGVYIDDVVQTGTTNDETVGVVVDNAAYFDWESEDDVDGGFIAGVNEDGVGVFNVSHDVVVLNGGTRGRAIDLSVIEDYRVYSEEGVLMQEDGLFGEYNEDGISPSRGIWGDWNGVAILNVDDVLIRNTTDDLEYEDGPVGGLIVGKHGDGIRIWDADSVDIDNEAGLIWGFNDGISIYESEDVDIYNALGTIMGYEDGAGIDIGPAEDGEDVAWSVNIRNASKFNEDGGIIAGDRQGIRVAAQNTYILNGEGGAILGGLYQEGGFSEDYYGQAVIELYSYYGDLPDINNEDGNQIQVVNDGLIATWISSEDAGEDGFLPHITWDDTLDFASTGSEEDTDLHLDLDAINSDISTFADFVWSGGAVGSLLNDDTDTSLSQYGNAASALAISSLGLDSEDEDGGLFGGLAPGGSAEVLNLSDGVILGRIALIGNSVFYDNEAEDIGYYGSAIQNDGVWYVKDRGYLNFFADGLSSSEDFAPSAIVASGSEDTFYGLSQISNSGLIQSAFDSEEFESATFLAGEFTDGPGDLGYFMNGWYRDSIYDSPSTFLFSEDGMEAYEPENGLFSLVDGGVGDVANFMTHFVGSEPGEDGHSYMALDVDFSPGEEYNQVDFPEEARADAFFIYGAVWGETGVLVNNINPGSTEKVGDVIQIGSAVYDENEDSGFYLAENQPGYIEVDGKAFIQDGLYAWSLETEDTGYSNYYLVSWFGPQAVQLPTITTAAQGVWYETAGVVHDHVYGQHFPVAGDGGAGADLEVGMEPQQVASAPETAVWGKISGSWTQQDTTVEQTPPGVTIDTSFLQNTFSLLGGADFQPMGAGGPIRVGVFGGYVSSSVEFDSYGASGTISGGTVGAYAAYTNGGFFADAQGKVDLLTLNYSAPIGADTEAAVTSIGIEANTGYRADLGAMFVEPVASLAYVNTTIDDMSVGTASVAFSNGDSLRGGLGVTVGTTIDTGNDTTTELAVLAKVWNEFEDANTVTVSDGVGGTVEFADNISGIFGEVRGTATVTSTDQSLSGFASAGTKFNEEFITVDAKLGVRKGF